MLTFEEYQQLIHPIKGIESQRKLLYVGIIPAFAQPVDVEFHQMKNGQYCIFWKQLMNHRQLLALSREEFNGYFYGAGFVMRKYLDTDEMDIVDHLLANPLPPETVKDGGLDGVSFTICAYSEPPQLYNFWVYLPAKWRFLLKVINIVISGLNLDYNYSPTILKN